MRVLPLLAALGLALALAEVWCAPARSPAEENAFLAPQVAALRSELKTAREENAFCLRRELAATQLEQLVARADWAPKDDREGRLAFCRKATALFFREIVRARSEFAAGLRGLGFDPANFRWLEFQGHSAAVFMPTVPATNPIGLRLPAGSSAGEDVVVLVVDLNPQLALGDTTRRVFVGPLSAYADRPFFGPRPLNLAYHGQVDAQTGCVFACVTAEQSAVENNQPLCTHPACAAGRERAIWFHTDSEENCISTHAMVRDDMVMFRAYRWS